MKIYLLNKEGKKSNEFINLSYLSFLKAHFLGYLGLILIMTFIIFLFSFVFFQ